MVHAIMALFQSDGSQDARGTLSFSRTTDRTVANTPANWALPFGVQEGYDCIFAISILETWPANLAPDAYAEATPAVCFAVQGLLAALMAACAVD